MKLLAEQNINILLWDKNFANKSGCQDCTGDNSQLSSNFLATHAVTGIEGLFTRSTQHNHLQDLNKMLIHLLAYRLSYILLEHVYMPCSILLSHLLAVLLAQTKRITYMQSLNT